MEISCSFGLGFVQRSHKPLNCWVRRVKPQLVENKHRIIKLYDVRRIGGPLVKFKRVLGFSPMVWVMNFQSTNSSGVKLFLDDFHDDS